MKCCPKCANKYQALLPSYIGSAKNCKAHEKCYLQSAKNCFIHENFYPQSANKWQANETNNLRSDKIKVALEKNYFEYQQMVGS